MIVLGVLLLIIGFVAHIWSVPAFVDTELGCEFVDVAIA
jgi:hypothetical protein